MAKNIEKSLLCRNLAELMDRDGLTEAELARRACMPQPTLHRILSGATKSPRGLSLRPLANVFNITINQLLGMEPIPNTSGDEGDDEGEGTGESRKGINPLPVLSIEQVNQWPHLHASLHKEGWQNWITTNASVSGEAYALSMPGDAMAPIFPEGTLLVVEPARKPRANDYVLAQYDGHDVATLRQYIVEDDQGTLKAVSPEFQAIHADKNYQVLGVVVQARRDYR